jgi:hypothetical protein
MLMHGGVERIRMFPRSSQGRDGGATEEEERQHRQPPWWENEEADAEVCGLTDAVACRGHSC